MRVVFFGSPEFALPSLKAIYESSHQIAAVITRPDKPKGRKRKVTPTAVKSYALKNGLKFLTPSDLSKESFVDEYKALNPLINIVVAYGKILPSWLIEFPPNKTLNAHASLLPKYRGAAPITRAIMAGETETGVTIQYMTEKLDAGDIALQKNIKITEDDNYQTLGVKSADLSAQMLLEALDLKEKGKLSKSKQDDSQASYAPKITKEELKIDFNQSADDLFNKIRALAPKPGAHSIFKEKRLKILKARVEDIKGGPGQVIRIDKAGILVGAKVKSLLLEAVQLEGSKVMGAFEFAKGHKIKTGEILK